MIARFLHVCEGCKTADILRSMWLPTFQSELSTETINHPSDQIRARFPKNLLDASSSVQAAVKYTLRATNDPELQKILGAV
jgi:hypothetical protein